MATAQCVPLHQFDAAYLSKLESGDQGIETHFARYFSQFLAASLRRRAATVEQIDEIRQETFARVLAAVHSKPGIRRPECFGAFVTSVSRNVLYESYRQGNRFEELDGIATERIDPDPSPETRCSLEEIRQKVRQVLSGLEGKDGTLLRAVYIDERDRDEICREWGISRGYLRVLLHRAKQQFRARFKKAITIKTDALAQKPGGRSLRRARTGGKPAVRWTPAPARARRPAPFQVILGGLSTSRLANA